MRLVKETWYGFDHAVVAQKFEGNPKFLNEFCVSGNYQPSAVYYVAKPNKRKKHKTYMLLTKSSDGRIYVSGMSPREMNKYRHQGAIHCLSCDDVIYSVNRHDFKKCTCGKVSVDGGKDYFKVGWTQGAPYKVVTVDLLTDTITDPKK